MWRGFSRDTPAGDFDAEGQLPDIQDARAVWIKGLFQETLPTFLEGYAPNDQIVLHVDSDLYSACLYVLTQCDHVLAPGSIVLFDEFSSVLDEFRALEDYCAAYYRRYEVVAVAGDLCDQVAIRLL